MIIRPLFLTLLSLLVLLSVATAYANAEISTMNVTVSKNSITINLDLVLRENLTSLPILHITLSQDNSTLVRNQVEMAAQRQVPTAHVELLTGYIGTMPPATNSGTWTLSENYTMVVTGTSIDLGGRVESNLAFLFLSTSAPMEVGTTEINKVGMTYLLGSFLALQTSGPTYFLGSSEFSKPPIPGNATAHFSFWDLIWVPPISQWDHTIDPFSSTSSWAVSPASPYNLTIATLIRENTVLRSYVAILDPNLQLSAPEGAWVQGTSIFFDLPTYYDFFMPGIIALSFAVLVGSVLFDRSLTSTKKLRRKGRN